MQTNKQTKHIMQTATKPRKYTRKDGRVTYKLNGNYHREDGPAVVHADGSQAWWINDKRHREDGPAVVCADGAQYWWINDIRYHTNDTFQKAAGISDDDMIVLILKYGDVT